MCLMKSFLVMKVLGSSLIEFGCFTVAKERVHLLIRVILALNVPHSYYLRERSRMIAT